MSASRRWRACPCECYVHGLSVGAVLGLVAITLRGGAVFVDRSRVVKADIAASNGVVHTIHGVGQYLGLRKLPIQGVPIDFLHLEYNGGNLYLPVVRIGEVQRYVGADGLKPRLDKLGGQTFAKTKRSVSKKVHALAEELLLLYAQRAALPGHAFPPPDAMFREFEATFEFEETPDQQTAIDAIAEDMEAFGVAMAASLAKVPLQVVRGISNNAGDRRLSQWKINDALNSAAQLALKLIADDGPAS